jgi:hypothetical protein
MPCALTNRPPRHRRSSAARRALPVKRTSKAAMRRGSAHRAQQLACSLWVVWFGHTRRWEKLKGKETSHARVDTSDFTKAFALHPRPDCDGGNTRGSHMIGRCSGDDGLRLTVAPPFVTAPPHCPVVSGESECLEMNMSERNATHRRLSRL